MFNTTHVMIADEDTAFTQLLAKTLSRTKSCSTVVLHTGKGLANAIRTHRPDILIVDFMLPDVNVLTVLQELRTLPKKQHPCIFVLSSFASPEASAECDRLGASFFLRKPISADALTDLVLRYGMRAPTETKPTDHEILRHITNLLNNMKFPAHVMGYRYLRDSIYMALKDPAAADSVTKILYPAIAKKHHATWTSVERDIRNAVSLAWKRSGEHFPGFHFSSRPANREFIYTVSERVRFDLRLDVFENIR